MVEETPNSPQQAVNITYETLFDLLRVEKSREDIQGLHASFYHDVVAYLQQKEELLKKKEHESDLRAVDELRKLRVQLDNIHKLIRDIYERRERKILDLALNKSRTQSTTITPQHLLPEELTFYQELIAVLDTTRCGVLQRLLQRQLPALHYSSSVPRSEDQKENKSLGILVRFLHPVPSFLGPSLEIHGPFLEHDVAYLPKEAASLLITKQRAERLS